MRFEKIFVPIKRTKAKNLNEIVLNTKPLNSIVALIGKNGAGKSRVLEYVSKYLDIITENDLVNGHLTFIPNSIRKTSPVEFKEFDEIHGQGTNVHSSVNLMKTKNMLTRHKSLLKNYVKVVSNDMLKTIKESFANKMTFEELLRANTTGGSDEVNYFNNASTVRYVNSLSDRIIAEEQRLYWELKRSNQFTQESIREQLTNSEFYKSFNVLKKYVKVFLKVDLDYTSIIDGNATTSQLLLDDSVFSLDYLSPGQKILFAYAVLFFYMEINSNTELRDCIIIIDEPELHLHPEAQIILIDALRSIVAENGQLWIATHSIHILSHLSYDEIFMVKNNSIVPPSRTTPGNSFNDLMGLEHHISELSEFVNSISKWAYSNFMVQCFNNPNVVFSSNTNDKQYLKFKDCISKDRLRVLDYGAGKGRLGWTIKSDDEIRDKIDYIAYEPDDKNLREIKAMKDIAWVSSISEIKDGAIDIVVLCNVLHEIHPKKWLQVFDDIKRVLADVGFLMIIEDRDLPKGENAHESGYLILENHQLGVLFDSDSWAELSDKLKKDTDDRIILFTIPKAKINPDIKSVRRSIELLMSDAFDNIKKIRRNQESINNDVSSGRVYANQTQLYINSILALEQLSKSPSGS